MEHKTFRVLLVEDDAPLRRLLRTALERSGRFVIVGEAADGRAGIDMAGKTRPDLILLDLAMPIMGGIEALPGIRNVAPASKVVALSMLQREQWEKTALDAGAVAFLDKSIPSRELIQRLLRIVGGDDGASAGRPPGPMSALPWLDDPWRLRQPSPWFPLRLRNPRGPSAVGRSEPTRASPTHSGPGPG